MHLTSNNISVEIHVNPETNHTDAQLQCHYDLDDDGLYSIHWYKDGREFYRFYPHRSPQSRTFIVNGANVDVSSLIKNGNHLGADRMNFFLIIFITQISKSNETVVFLTSVDGSSSGSYRFDAYGDPSFTHIFQEIDLDFNTTRTFDAIN